MFIQRCVMVYDKISLQKAEICQIFTHSTQAQIIMYVTESLRGLRPREEIF
jgi:hypothetical protein